MSGIDKAAVNTPATDSGSGATGKIDLTVSGTTITFSVGLVDEGGWCITSLSSSGGGLGGSSVPSDGSSFGSGGSSEAPSSDSGSGGSTGLEEPGATTVGLAYFAALGAHNLSAIQSLICPGVPNRLTQAEIDTIDSARADGPATNSNSGAIQYGTLTAGADSGRIRLTFEHPASGWCISKSDDAS